MKPPPQKAAASRAGQGCPSGRQGAATCGRAHGLGPGDDRDVVSYYLSCERCAAQLLHETLDTRVAVLVESSVDP